MASLEIQGGFSYTYAMKALTRITPYSDASLEWDEGQKRYVLTIQRFKAEFGSNFADDQTLLRRLRKNSRKVYNFIRYRGHTSNWAAAESAINKTEEGRNFILACLLEEMEADNESGFNDLSSAPAVNITNGQVIDRSQLAANQISVDCEQVISSSASYLGFSCPCAQPYPYPIRRYLESL